MLCIPCFPASTAIYFDEEPVSEAEVKSTDDSSLKKPTGAEYAGEAAKEFLKVLDDVAKEIPIPGVSAAVTIATNLIIACEESYARLEKAEELKLRIKTLVTVVVNELKEKKSDEIKEKLKEDIDALRRELKYIEKNLEEIASQHALLLVFFKSINEEKVQNCMNRLDGLIERFTIARHIDHANLLDRLEEEIISFYTAQKQTFNQIQDKLNDMDIAIEDVRTILKAPAAASSSPSARAPIPTKTSLLYGRDILVSDLAARLTSKSDGRKRDHLCILGPGGMGKTSTALAVMAHSGVKELYPDGNCVWVPCVKATSIPLFLDTLCSSLGIVQMTGNVINKILSVLKSSGPLILLLDNFETPWNIDGERSETERIISEIGQIPDITLFVTMRFSTAPCNWLSWHTVDLKAVDADAARQIYSGFHRAGSTDPKLPALLELVGNMPLAITLMATTASVTGLSVERIMEQYKAVGPTLLSQGSDGEHNMDICISLSVDSPPMKQNNEAQWLLGALAMLPTGATFDMLSRWWARHLTNLAGSLQVLRETSLAELQDGVFSILPVIQRYVLHPSRFNANIRNSMIESACQYLEEHKANPSNELYPKHAKALATEETNLEAVLLQANVASTEIVNALLILAGFQAIARPRTNAIQHALELVRQMDSSRTLHASVLLCYGNISHNLDRFNEAEKHFSNARELFLFSSNVKQAADCLLRIMDISLLVTSKPYAELTSSVSQAQSEFECIGDINGVAQCWFYHGSFASSAGLYDAAFDLLHCAYNKFMDLKDPLFTARCSTEITRTYYRTGDLEQADTWSHSALEQFGRLGPSQRGLAAALHQGWILNAKGNYGAALKVFIQCLEQAKNFGAPLLTGAALREMGISWMKIGKKDDARGALTEALGVFPSMDGRGDHDLCRYLLRKMDQSDTVPTLTERAALDWQYPPRIQQLLKL